MVLGLCTWVCPLFLSFFMVVLCLHLISRWMYENVRNWINIGLASVDSSQSATLSELLNVSLSDSFWTQVSLLVRWGGVGVTGIVDLAPSAFLASAHLGRPLISSLLQPLVLASFNAMVLKAIDR